MSDATGSGAAAAAWHVDPTNAAQWRWWDGTQWTDDVAEVRPTDPAATTEQAGQLANAAAGRWPMPAAGAPLVPRDGYSRQAHPSVAKAFAQLQLRRAPQLLLVGIGSVIVMGLGLLIIRMTTDVFVYGALMWRRANHRIRVESRDEPWGAAFRKRGLLPAAGLRGRCSSLPVLISSSAVEARWAASGELRGFPATCGELVAEFVAGDDGQVERWRWLMFAAFEIPPNAAARHRKVGVRMKGSLLGAGDGGASGRRLHLESIAVDEQLSIHVDERTDDVTARELFGPQLVAALADHPVAWDQRGRWLLVFRDSGREPICEFDAFLESAAAVARAYWMDQD